MFKTNNLDGWIIPADTEIAAGTEIPRYSEIGNRCTIDEDSDLFCDHCNRKIESAYGEN